MINVYYMAQNYPRLLLCKYYSRCYTLTWICNPCIYCPPQFCIVISSHYACVVATISVLNWHDGQSRHNTSNGWNTSILSHTTTWWLLDREFSRSCSNLSSILVLPNDNTIFWQVTTKFTEDTFSCISNKYCISIRSFIYKTCSKKINMYIKSVCR